MCDGWGRCSSRVATQNYKSSLLIAFTIISFANADHSKLIHGTHIRALHQDSSCPSGYKLDGWLGRSTWSENDILAVVPQTTLEIWPSRLAAACESTPGCQAFASTGQLLASIPATVVGSSSDGPTLALSHVCVKAQGSNWGGLSHALETANAGPWAINQLWSQTEVLRDILLLRAHQGTAQQHATGRRKLGGSPLTQVISEQQSADDSVGPSTGAALEQAILSVLADNDEKKELHRLVETLIRQAGLQPGSSEQGPQVLLSAASAVAKLLGAQTSTDSNGQGDLVQVQQGEEGSGTAELGLGQTGASSDDIQVGNWSLAELAAGVAWPYWDSRKAAYTGGPNWVGCPIKNQGGCGACISFSLAAAAEAAISTVTSNDCDANISPQFWFYCVPPWKPTCQTGWDPDSALSTLATHGAVYEHCYPWGNPSACTNLCQTGQPSKPVYLSSSGPSSVGGTWAAQYFEADQVAKAKEWIRKYGGVVAAFTIHNDFLVYRGGIYDWDGKSGGAQGHAVLTIGWNDTGRYWIAKNSWGTTWGEHGFFRISYDHSTFMSQVTYGIKWTPPPGFTGPPRSPSPPSPSPSPSTTRQPAGAFTTPQHNRTTATKNTTKTKRRRPKMLQLQQLW